MLSDVILVTGGYGFIGSNFILRWSCTEQSDIVNLDKLTYAGNVRNLERLNGAVGHEFVQWDIADSATKEFVLELMQRRRIKAIVHFAAESHVDRSIRGPAEFVRTNIQGTFELLECARIYWQSLSSDEQEQFRFVHVSTDEVYGSLGPNDPAFTETTAYAPNSPYSASKAASDHMVRAYHHTYKLPTLTTNCSNNYGPFQFPEKLIPLMILHARQGKPLPIYGNGSNVRDWLFVEDHCDAIRTVLRHGRLGETYNIGGHSERSNLEVVNTICATLDELIPKADGTSYSSQITFVKDRPGHDHRYAIDTTKIESELGWKPQETFASGLRRTIQWYLDNDDWTQSVTSGEYRNWISKQYALPEPSRAYVRG